MSSTPAFSRLLGAISSSRRVHLEVHAQRLRLQHPGQHSDHVSRGMGAVEDPGICRPRECAEFPWILGAGRLLERGSALLYAQIGGAGAVPSVALAGGSTPFRIDHDEKFNLTTHLQYQPWKTGPWFGFNWRYDSGLVAGQTPCFGGNCAQGITVGGTDYISLTDSFGVPLTADQEFESGLFCGTQRATPNTVIGMTVAPGPPGLPSEPVRVYSLAGAEARNGK